MLYQIFLSPQTKRCAIITYKRDVYELPHELPNYLRLNAILIIGQRKSFCRQRFPEFSCVRKDTLEKDILIKSRKGDRKIMQLLRITSEPTRIRKQK